MNKPNLASSCLSRTEGCDKGVCWNTLLKQMYRSAKKGIILRIGVKARKRM